MTMSQQFDPALFESVACDFCGSFSSTVRFEPKQIPTREQIVLSVSHGQRDSQRIVQCTDCGLVYVNPRLRRDLVLSGYKGSAETDYAAQAENRMNTFHRCLGLVERMRPDKGGLLDIGAAAGFFMKVAHDAGWHVTGVEPSAWLCQFGREKLGLDIIEGALEPGLFDAERFDVITMWDVIEHLHNPSQAVITMHRWLKKGGLLVMNTPNVDGTLARLFGRSWWFYMSVHLYYFSPKVLSHRLQELGFRTVETRRHFQTLSLGHLIGMFSMYAPRLADAGQRLARRTGLASVSVKYYAGQFTIVAEKQ